MIGEYTNFPNGVTSFGIPLPGGSRPWGKHWFVDQGGGAPNYPGKGSNQAFTTIQGAIDSASAGDTIHVKGIAGSVGQTSDYSESVTIPYTKPGLAIIGEGNSDSEGVLWTCETQNDVMISVKARDCLVQGFRLRPNGTTGWAVGLYRQYTVATNDSSGFTLRNCVIRSTTQTSGGINMGGTLATNNQGANDVTIERCIFDSVIYALYCSSPATVPSRTVMRDVYITGSCTHGVSHSVRRSLFERVYVADLGGGMMMDTDMNGGAAAADNRVKDCSFGDENSAIAEVNAGDTDCWAGSYFGNSDISATYVDTPTNLFVTAPNG